MPSLLEYAPYCAVGVMGLFMIWYWLVAYKLNVFHIHWLPSLFIGAIVPLGLFSTLVVSLLFSAFPLSSSGFILTENMRWLPLVALVMVFAMYGAVLGSVLGSFSDAAREKHKIWYVCGISQLLIIIDVLLR